MQYWEEGWGPWTTYLETSFITVWSHSQLTLTTAHTYLPLHQIKVYTHSNGAWPGKS